MDLTQDEPHGGRPSWLDRPLLSVITINWETVLFTGILILAIVSRFYDLGTRVMSHDETSHVYFSWLLEQGRGYKHDPITHGPLQFHLIALSYFLFGDNDFSARIPVALASIATVAFVWNYRRYLGRAGALVAAFLLLISPFILYYGRYARNEAYVGLFGVMTLWAILRYLETGLPRYMYWLTAATILHFTAKETAFIYTAQALIFLAVFFLVSIYRAPWPFPSNRIPFLIGLFLAMMLLGAAAGSLLLRPDIASLSPTETAQPAIPGEESLGTATPLSLIAVSLGGLGLLALLAAAYFLIRGSTLPLIRSERSFDLLVLLGTLVLPMLAPFPVKALGWNPLDYATQGMLRTAVFLVPLAALAIGIGLWWNARVWLGNAALFYAIFTILYTTIFTNGTGFFTGLVGSLGYWLVQHGVNRGGQPWYYYLFVQVPMYEYLPALGSMLALALALFGKRTPMRQLTEDDRHDQRDATTHQPAFNGEWIAVTLLGFWIVTSFLAYSYAGEKMPWLTFHITLPMILLAGWGIGQLIESTQWASVRAWRGILALALVLVFLVSLYALASSLLGANPPFQGKELEQLNATSSFLTALVIALGSGWGVFTLMKDWQFAQVARLLSLTFLGLLALLTARAAIRAAYINYDYATEFLVYAHSGPGPKEILAQIEEISRRTTDGLALQVAYDDETTYPFWWYLRNYSNTRFYGANPTRDIREAPIILVGAENYGKVEPIAGQAYYRFDYIRMWWPMQDYFNLNMERVMNALTHREWRSAVFQIWLNRDYSQYAALVNRDMSLPNWQPSAEMRMYLRKDIAAQVWNYGVGPSPEQVVADPFEGKEVQLEADLILGSSGAAPGQFNRPRDLEVAADGSIFVADTDNHRIQHIDRDGSPLHTWGSFADIAQGPAPEGSFYEPWGLGLGPDGSVYVADTWNHRIQKFSPEGEFLTMWGYFGQAETPTAFWGPRDVAVDDQGRVYVTDTGNKRIVIFDADGNFISEFGGEGFALGEFSEPVGIDVDAEGQLYVADTWNQRIQVFAPDGSGGFRSLKAWDVYAWFGQSLDNKPYITVDDNGRVFATDPEGYRVLEFTSDGEIVRFWGDYSLGVDGFGLAGAPAVDPQGGLWVSDPGNSRLMHFSLPEN
ncbi:MAG TPA: flippase activity-associated protein Agl23 [Anaerolineales bacterium]|nr:flippase activity-associated protein Agl23 [Anaerolineales bacterium]